MSEGLKEKNYGQIKVITNFTLAYYLKKVLIH